MTDDRPSTSLVASTVVDDAALPAVTGRESRWPRRLRRLRGTRHYEFGGLIGATAFFCLSLTPSLLPRSAVVQGLISGIIAATGYGFGVLVVWVGQSMSKRPLPSATPRVWRMFGGVAAVAIVTFLYLGARWQGQLYRLMGLDQPSAFGFPIVLLIAAGCAIALVGLVRGLRRLSRRLAVTLGRWVPPNTARVLAATILLVLTAGLADGVVGNGLVAAADRVFSTVNGETHPDVHPPQDPLRSGSPASTVSWASLGSQGRTFVSGGPDVDQIRQFSGTDVKSPIRVYAGLESAATSRGQAALAVQELRRTGAFSRKVLCVITTTGTGWVNDKAVDPLEYMYAGDTALVSMQYSYLPSPISFLVDKERARAAGRDLFDQVYAVWSRLPPGQRPRLLVFGESLGSFGAESAFSGIDDVHNRTDGMLLIGPPSHNGLWTHLVADRDPGSPAILPTYEQRDTTVRFASTAADLPAVRPAGDDASKLVYLQHPSDPITWWSPRLILHRPDWLREPRGVDVLPSMRWIPMVTFWQLTLDMAVSNNVPPGHGHNYGTTAVAAWAYIASPPGWTAERTTTLSTVIADGHD